MYILKNSLISIARNKGRNILIGIIILVIACASTTLFSYDEFIKSSNNKGFLLQTI